MQEHFGWTETTKGLVLSSFFIGYLLFQVPAGYLASRIGGKRVLGFAVIWWSVFTLLTPWAAMVSLPVLIAARIAMGLGEAAALPATYSLLGRWVPKGERSRSVSVLLSGIPIGTLVALAASGYLMTSFGWPSVFYVFGAVGIVWALAWFPTVHDDPARHPGISAQERALLPGAAESGASGDVVPWKQLLSQPAVWALIVNHFCNNWSLYVLLAWLPSYFRKALGLSIANAGLASALPWLTMFVMFNVSAWMADSAIRRGVSITAVRKTMQSIGLLGSAFFLICVIGVTDAGKAQLLMCGALGALAFNGSGFTPNHLDIAPRYAGVLMGLTNTVATVPGIIGVAITGWLVETSGTYASAFILTAAISVVGALVWLLFSTGRRVVD